MPHDRSLPPDVEQLTQQLLAHPQPLRRGSLYQRTTQCNKPGCPCADDFDARHGPYFTLTWTVHGHHHARVLSPKQAEVAKTQIGAGRRFRKTLDDYWDACEHWADTQLETPEAADEAAKKGGSNKPSTTRPTKRSKRF